MFGGPTASCGVDCEVGGFGFVGGGVCLEMSSVLVWLQVRQGVFPTVGFAAGAM